jgi:hypothetical protein
MVDGLLHVGIDAISDDRRERHGHRQDQQQEMGSYRRCTHSLTPLAPLLKADAWQYIRLATNHSDRSLCWYAILGELSSNLDNAFQE